MFYRIAGILMLVGGIYGFFWVARWSDQTLREQGDYGLLGAAIGRLPPRASKLILRGLSLFMAAMGSLNIYFGGE